MNICSYLANLDGLEAMLGPLVIAPDIFVLMETWLNDCNCDLCNIQCFQSFHTCQTDRQSGGVSVLCREFFDANCISDLSLCGDDIETCVVNCKLMASVWW